MDSLNLMNALGSSRLPCRRAGGKGLSRKLVQHEPHALPAVQAGALTEKCTNTPNARYVHQHKPPCIFYQIGKDSNSLRTCCPHTYRITWACLSQTRLWTLDLIAVWDPQRHQREEIALCSQEHLLEPNPKLGLFYSAPQWNNALASSCAAASHGKEWMRS